MKIYKNFSVTKKKDLEYKFVVLFYFDNSGTFIQAHKGSLDDIEDLVKQPGQSHLNKLGHIRTNCVYERNKNELRNLLTVIKIMKEKDAKGFEENYVETKEYMKAVANHKKYFIGIYNFLKG